VIFNSPGDANQKVWVPQIAISRVVVMPHTILFYCATFFCNHSNLYSSLRSLTDV